MSQYGLGGVHLREKVLGPFPSLSSLLPPHPLCSSGAGRWHYSVPDSSLCSPAPAFLTVMSVWTAIMPALKHTQFPPLCSRKSPGQEPGNPACSPHSASTSLVTWASFGLGSERPTTFLPCWARTSGEPRAGGGGRSRVIIYSTFSIY